MKNKIRTGIICVTLLILSPYFNPNFFFNDLSVLALELTDNSVNVTGENLSSQNSLNENNSIATKNDSWLFNLNNSLDINKAIYGHGKTVYIKLAAAPEYITNFSILGPENVFYAILPSNNGEYEFIPDSTGKYVITVSLDNGSQKKFQTAEFEVVDFNMVTEFGDPEHEGIVPGRSVNWSQQIVISNPMNFSVSDFPIDILLPLDYSNLFSDAGFTINNASVLIDLAPGERRNFTIFYQTSPLMMAVSDEQINILDLIPKDAFDIALYREIEAGLPQSTMNSNLSVKRLLVWHNSTFPYHNIPINISVDDNEKVFEIIDGSVHEISASIQDETASFMIPELYNRTFFFIMALEQTQEKAKENEPVEWQLNIQDTIIKYKTTASPANVTSPGKVKKSHFRIDENPEFIFDYANDAKIKPGKASASNKIAAVDEQLTAPGASGIIETGKVKSAVYAADGKITDLEPQIKELSDGKVSIKLPKKRAFRAGVYTLEVEYIKDGTSYIQEQEFQWGLVSLNTRKSIYKPGENAEFIIVVLDKYGHPVSNADISLTVSDPNNKTRGYWTGDGTITLTYESGVYAANYPPEMDGNHTIDITASFDGIEVFFTTFFQVKQEYEFDIVRFAKSKIDPTVQDIFEVHLDIESYTGANSITIEEFVPSVFEISNTDALITTLDDVKILSWDKTIIENRTSVAYRYSVPHIWPYLYALGPSKIEYGSETFTEARPWYVAVDPAPSVRLNDPLNASHIYANWALLNATVTDPDIDLMTVSFYANNNSNGLNASDGLVYIARNVSNGSNITYNLTALPVKSSEEGLVALYHFDNRSEYGENDTYVYDFSGNNNNGTGINFDGDEVNLTGGKFAGGFKFVGADDYIDVGKLNSIAGSSEMTISVWINPSFFPYQNGDNDGVFQQSDDWGNYIGIRFDGAGGAIQFEVVSGNEYSCGIFVSTSELSIGNWSHLLYTFNNGITEGYINGVSKGTGNCSASYTTIPALTNNWLIGSRTSSSDRFNGSIDEVAIYNRSLSASEIIDQYRLAEGKYYWKVNSTDGILSNESSTWEFTIDTIKPGIDYIYPTPANGTIQSLASVYVNVTTSDINNHSAFIDWDRSLVGWWNFETVLTNGTVYDTSSYSNNGILVNHATNATKSGIRGQALEFDGVNDEVYISNSASLNFSTNDFSISTWIKSDGSDIQPFLNKEGLVGVSLYLRGNGYVRVDFSDGGGTTQSTNDGTDLRDNSWHHLVVNFDRDGSMTRYVDGVVHGTGDDISNRSGDIGTSESLRFGGGGGSFFKGSMDEVMIWNRLLSLEEINATYQAGTYRLYNNFTGLSDGTHNYTAYVIDAAGNVNQTETRNVTVDTSAPGITFIYPTPANGTIQSSTSVYVNVTTSDINNHSAFIDWDRSLVGWWNFENVLSNGTVYDNSNYGHDGTLYNHMTNTTVDGKRGHTIEFDGIDDYINITNTASLNLTDAITVEAWINIKNRAFFDGIVSKDYVTSWYFGTANSNNSLSVFINGEARAATVPDVYNTSEWTHVAFTYDMNAGGTDEVKIYINGNVNAIGDYSTAIGTNNFNISISNNYDYNFNGSIDEVKIYSRALSPEEINASYNAGTYKLFKNFTGLSDGTHNYTAYVIDAAGNVNQTETRTVTIDSTPPNVTLKAPDNASIISNAWSMLNATVTDNLQNLTVSFYANNNSNGLNASDGLVSIARNVSNGSNITYNLTALPVKSSEVGLVALYHFDNRSEYGENASHVYDFTGKGNNGTVNGSTFNRTGGYFAGAYEFGNSHHINAGNSSSINLTGNITVLAWIKANDLVEWDTILMKTTANDAWGDGYGLYYANGKLWFYVTQFDNYVANMSFSSTGMWHHVVGTYDGTKIKISIDGVEGNSTPYTGAIKTTSSPLYIGAGAENLRPSYFFDGTIDEVAIYNRSLSNQEVLNHYRLGDGKYYWKVNATDGILSNESNTWEFTVEATRPLIILNSPTNRSIISQNYTVLNATVTDEGNDTTTVSIYANPDSNGLNASAGLVYFKKNVTNGTTVTYNLTALPTNMSLHRDNLWLLYHIDNRSEFGENTTHMYDFSGNGRNATISWYLNINSTPVLVDNAKLGGGIKAIKDACNGWFSHSDSTKLHNFTISMWINSTQPTDSGGHLVGGGGMAGGIDISDSNNVSYVNSTNNRFYSNTNFPRNEWHHITFARDNSSGQGNFTFYLDGIYDGGFTDSKSISPNNFGEMGCHAYSGYFDEIAVWNTTLTPAEIRSLSQLKPQTYYWKVNVTDGSLSNESEVWEFTIDTIRPEINFTYPTPANGTIQSATSVYVNVTTSDTNNHSAFIDWNRSLVGWWNFDTVLTNGSVYDNSSYSNNGILYNHLTNTTVGGERGKAIEFDGVDDYIDAGSPSFGTADYSISAWIKQDNSTDNQVILHYTNNAELEDIGFRIVNGKLNLFDENNDRLTGNTTLLTNTWYHVCGMLNNVSGGFGDFKLYLNGNLDGSTRTTYDPWGDGTGLTIGDRFQLTQPFNGSIDEIMIFSRAISAQEINALYNAGTYRLYNNFTGLSDGTHNYTAYVIDAAGNVNQTETRTVTIDSTPPNVTLNAPDNASIISNAWSMLNATVTDNLQNLTVSFYANNNSNGLNASDGLVYMARNVTNGTDVTYNLTSLPVKSSEEGLVALYHFDNRSEYGENASYTYDFKGGDDNLKAKNLTAGTCGVDGACPLWNLTGGKFGGAFEFDGIGDYLDVGVGGGTTSGLNKITLMAWIKRKGASSTGFESIVETAQNNENTHYLVSNCGDNNIHFGYTVDYVPYATTISNSLVNDGD